MKLKNKMIVLLLIIFTILLVVPSMVNAATSTYDDTAQGITWSYELDTGGNIINLKCNTTGVTGTVTIPSTIDGKNVISLAEDKSYGTGAFEECAGITEVIIPNTITKIGYAAFMNCTGLTTITIPDSVTSIGNSAFGGCSGLTAVTLSANLTTIGNGAFRSCTGLTTISIPNKVTMIGNSAFSNCSGLSEVVLSEALTKIPGGCFRECTALKSITLPSSVTTIKNGGLAGGYGAFEGCSALEKILIPDAVATIDNDVFSGCNRLTIYGTEGKRSYTYAQENNINFKLISEWDNVDVGDDITPPTLEKLKIENGGSFVYDSGTRYYMVAPGTKISIKASFGEMLFGDTAPTLTIKCGKGEERKLTNGVITGSYIVYTYEIRTNDVGIISAVEMSGGNVKDEAGNAVTGYSCPTLSTTSDILVYANGTISNPGTTPDNENGEWTDFSNAKFELKKNNVNGAMLEISNVTPKDGNNYYLFITTNSSKPNVTSENENKKYINYNKESKKFNNVIGMEKYVELNQDLYVTILEVQSYGSEKIVSYGKKLERYEEPKYSDAFYATYMCYKSTQIVTTFTHDEGNNRNIQIKVGKITDTSILRKIKNQDSSGFADLLAFAKSNNGIYNKKHAANKDYYTIAYVTDDNFIDLEGLQDEEYYFLYIEVYDDDGKYIGQEAVTLAQASVHENGEWYLFFYGDKDFEWADFGEVESDDTKAPNVLPDTGKFTIFSIVAVIAVTGVVSFIKTRKYKGI